MSSNIILTLNLEEDSILLNEGILNALDWPRQIQLLINTETKQLVLRACTVEDAHAVVIEADNTQQCEISGRRLLKKISHLVGWEDKQPRMCRGEYLPAHQAVRFNLADAETLELEVQ